MCALEKGHIELVWIKVEHIIIDIIRGPPIVYGYLLVNQDKKGLAEILFAYARLSRTRTAYIEGYFITMTQLARKLTGLWFISCNF